MIDKHIEYCTGCFACKRNGGTCIHDDDMRDILNEILESDLLLFSFPLYCYGMHVLRDDPAFIPELDFVMEQDGRLIGQNMFMKTVIEADDGRTNPVLTMKRILYSIMFLHKPANY